MLDSFKDSGLIGFEPSADKPHPDARTHEQWLKDHGMTSQMFCNHANECPHVCPCAPNCECRLTMCRDVSCARCRRRPRERFRQWCGECAEQRGRNPPEKCLACHRVAPLEPHEMCLKCLHDPYRQTFPDDEKKVATWAALPDCHCHLCQLRRERDAGTSRRPIGGRDPDSLVSRRTIGGEVLTGHSRATWHPPHGVKCGSPDEPCSCVQPPGDNRPHQKSCPCPRCVTTVQPCGQCRRGKVLIDNRSHDCPACEGKGYV